jgi:hypothetical protein
MASTEEIIPLSAIAERYGIALRTLEDRKWRARVGLPVLKLGGKVIGVRAVDLRRALRREHLASNGGAA